MLVIKHIVINSLIIKPQMIRLALWVIHIYEILILDLQFLVELQSNSFNLFYYMIN